MTDPRLTSRRWKATVRAVLARDRHECAWCGARATSADHVIPRSLGGSDAMSNLVAACGPCNSSRGARLAPPPRLRAARPVFWRGLATTPPGRELLSPAPPRGDAAKQDQLVDLAACSVRF